MDAKAEKISLFRYGLIASEALSARRVPTQTTALGGNTKFYGAALFRSRKEDFGEMRHHGGISPVRSQNPHLVEESAP